MNHQTMNYDNIIFNIILYNKKIYYKIIQLCMILYCVSKPYTQFIAGTSANSTTISACDFTCSLTTRQYRRRRRRWLTLAHYTHHNSSVIILNTVFPPSSPLKEPNPKRLSFSRLIKRSRPYFINRIESIGDIVPRRMNVLHLHEHYNIFIYSS